VTVNDLLGKPDSFDIIIASQFDTICADVVCSEGSCYSTLMNGLSRGNSIVLPSIAPRSFRNQRRLHA
jgi:hypothetical protein